MGHPLVTIAKRGRADVLRALGRLDEALTAYDAILAEDPQDDIARNGRSCVLAALHRYDEALEHLPDENLVTLQDWIGYLIRGMVLLSLEDIDGALRVFEIGMEESPWSNQREYFRLAESVALSKKDNTQAIRTLEQSVSNRLQPQANVLRLHSFGELESYESAKNAYYDLIASPHHIPDELVNELHRRYILKEEPRHDDEWVFDQELSILLLMA